MELTLLFFIMGSSLFILVGLLHLFVHFTQLNSSEAEMNIKLAKDITVMNRKANVWRLWVGFSLLFGVLLIGFGTLDILSLYVSEAHSSPSILVCITNMILLMFIIYTGHKYFGKMQFYGGILGYLLFGFTVALMLF